MTTEKATAKAKTGTASVVAAAELVALGEAAALPVDETLVPLEEGEQRDLSDLDSTAWPEGAEGERLSGAEAGAESPGGEIELQTVAADIWAPFGAGAQAMWQPATPFSYDYSGSAAAAGGNSGPAGGRDENGSGATVVAVGASGDQRIDGLIAGNKWVGSITYSDPDSTADYQAGYPAAPLNGFSQLTAQQLLTTHFALNDAAYTQPANAQGFSIEGFTSISITYAGSGSGSGTIRSANSSDPGTAYAYYPSNSITGGDAFYGNSGTTPTAGNYHWHTVLHELGHSMGLKHGQDPANFGALPASWDSMEFSVMTYRSYVGAPLSGYTNEFWGYAQTYMMLDIAALQHMYGADFTTNSGSTVYKWNPGSGDTLVDGQVAIDTGGNRIFATIWDGNGIDTYDLSSYGTNLDIDLAPGSWSTFDSTQIANLGNGNFARANIFNAMQYNGDARSLIENAIGGSGNDRIDGNIANNVLTGNNGNDTLNGLDGNDTLIGGLGNDVLSGGNGNDIFEIFAGSHINDNNSGGAGTDKILLRGAGTFDFASSAYQHSSIEEIEFNADGLNTKIANFSLQEFDNTVEIPANLLIDSSGGGTDILNFSALGSLFATIDWSGWTFQNWDDSLDQINVTLGGAVTSFTGTQERDNITGGVNAEMIDGGADNDSILGGTGNDTLIGGLGNDTLNGGNGLDSIDAGAGDDLIVDLEFMTPGQDDTYNGGAGIDTLQHDLNWTSGVHFDLGTGRAFVGVDGRDHFFSIENLIVGGDAQVTGSSDDNVLTVNGSGANLIDAGAGEDTVNAGGGNDTITDTQSMFSSGAEDDVYDGGAGIDTLVHDLNWVSSVHFDLSAGFTFFQGARDQLISIENLVVGGSAQVTGSSDDNVLTVNGSGANLIDAGAGEDTVNAGGGNDTITDTQSMFSSGAEDDVYDGGAGIDTLVHDLNWVSSVHFDLSAGFTFFQGARDQLISIENLVVGGSAQVTGSSDDNVLTVNGSGSNFINSRDGNDTINAGGGNDTLIGGNGNDLLNGEDGDDVLAGANGADTINGGAGNDTLNYAGDSAGVHVRLFDGFASGGQATGDVFTGMENLNGGSGHDRLVGNSSANMLVGNSGNDSLVGGGGNDTLIGAAGADQFSGGAGADLMQGGGGNDTLNYQGSAAGVEIRLFSTFADGGDATGDSFGNMENVIGSNFDDKLVGNGLGNVLEGLAGDDLLIGANGADTLLGGSGTDTISYQGDSSGVDIRLATGFANGGQATGDVFTNIENVIGGTSHDYLAGDGGNNALTGLGGNDTIVGGGGADTMIGGGGNDTLSYQSDSTGVDVRLFNGFANGGHATGDVFTNFENLIGGTGADKLVGNNGANIIEGGGNNDEINGGRGNDTLTGDGGLDEFVFFNLFGQDVITDFSSNNGEDINLSAVTAITDFNDLINNHLNNNGGFAEIFVGANTILLAGVAFGSVGIGLAYSADDFIF